MMLGKLPYKHDDRTLVLHHYMALSQLPSPPETWPAPSLSWGMMLNDRIGDCAIASPGHMEMLWTNDAGQEYTPPDADLLTAYEHVSGYNGDPSTDNGCVILDVLKYWQSTGISNHKIGAFCRVDTQDVELIRQGIYLFGALDFGFQLPLAAQQMTDVWDITGNGPEWQVGSWGGHSVAAVGWDANGIQIVTWGKLVTVTWAFMATFADEAWACLSPDFKSTAGFDAAQLQADLAVVQGQSPPVSCRWWQRLFGRC